MSRMHAAFVAALPALIQGADGSLAAIQRPTSQETLYLSPIESALFSKTEYFIQLREKLTPNDKTLFGLPESRGPHIDIMWFRCFCTTSNEPEWFIGVVDADKPRIIYSCFTSKIISETGQLTDATVDYRNVEISASLREALVKGLAFVVSETRIQPIPKWTKTSQCYYFNVGGIEGGVTNPQPESRPGKAASLARALRDLVRQGTPVTSEQEQQLLHICQSIEN